MLESFYYFTLIIAVPTGIKIWATVRVYAEMLIIRATNESSASAERRTSSEIGLKGSDGRVESTEDYSAYSEAAMIGGQKPALKRTMRGDADLAREPKIGLTVIG